MSVLCLACQPPPADVGRRSDALSRPGATSPSSPDGDLLALAALSFRPRGSVVLATGQRHRVSVSSDGEVGFGSPAIEAGPLPLRLQTIAIARGLMPLGASAPVRASEGTCVGLDWGTVQEEIENSASHIEQRWRLDEEPLDSGQLAIRVITSGLAHDGVDASLGHRFAGTGGAFRYGHAIFIDGTGATTPVPVTYEAGAIVLRVPDAILSAATYPAELVATITPELDPGRSGALPRGEHQTEAAIATDGTDYLVVFEDELAGDADIAAARVSGASGEVLESFYLAREPNSLQRYPEVVWNGSRYIVVWRDDRETYREFNLWLTTVEADGTQGTPRQLVDANLQRGSQLASTGGVTMLAWVGDTPSSARRVLMQRLDAAGAGLDVGPVELAIETEGAGGSVSAAASADGFLVAWDGDGGSVQAVRVPITGPVVESPFVLFDGSERMYDEIGALADNGAGGYLAIASGVASFWATTIPTTGPIGTPPASLVHTPVQPSPSDEVAFASRPSLAPRAAGGFVLTHDTRTIRFGSPVEVLASVAAAATVDVSGGSYTSLALEPATSSLLLDQYRGVDVASTGAGQMIVYADRRSGPSDLHLAPVTAAGLGTSSGARLVEDRQETPLVAIGGNGTENVALWRDYALEAGETWGMRMSADGALIGSPFLVSADPDVFVHHVAWDGARYIAAYERRHRWTAGGVVIGAEAPIASDVGYIRFTAGGPVDDARDLPDSTFAIPEYAPQIACTTAACILVNGIFLPEGGVPGGPITPAFVWWSIPPTDVAPTPHYHLEPGMHVDPVVASNGDRVLISWTRIAGGEDIWGMFPGEPAFPITATGHREREPSVSSDETGFLVAYSDNRSGGATPWDVRVQDVAPDGTLGGNRAVAAVADIDERHPALGFAGRYAVTYLSGPESARELSLRRLGPPLDDPIPFTIPHDGAPYRPLIAGAATTGSPRWLVGHLAVSGTRVRAKLRLFGEDRVAGQACLGLEECGSGYCVDGVCCDTACEGGTTDCNACSIAAGGSTDGVCGPVLGCVPDAGTDAGADSGTDAGSGADSGTPTDAGVGVDGGPTIDAGTPDAGGDADVGADAGPSPDTDAGPADSGTPATPDAALELDAGGLVDAGLGDPAGGCGCSSVGRASSQSPLLLIAGLLAWAGRRRRPCQS